MIKIYKVYNDTLMVKNSIEGAMRTRRSGKLFTHEKNLKSKIETAATGRQKHKETPYF